MPKVVRIPGRLQHAGGQVNIWLDKDAQAMEIYQIKVLLEEHGMVDAVQMKDAKEQWHWNDYDTHSKCTCLSFKDLNVVLGLQPRHDLWLQ